MGGAAEWKEKHQLAFFYSDRTSESHVDCMLHNAID